MLGVSRKFFIALVGVCSGGLLISDPSNASVGEYSATMLCMNGAQKIDLNFNSKDIYLNNSKGRFKVGNQYKSVDKNGFDKKSKTTLDVMTLGFARFAEVSQRTRSDGAFMGEEMVIELHPHSGRSGVVKIKNNRSVASFSRSYSGEKTPGGEWRNVPDVTLDCQTTFSSDYPRFFFDKDASAFTQYLNSIDWEDGKKRRYSDLRTCKFVDVREFGIPSISAECKFANVTTYDKNFGNTFCEITGLSWSLSTYDYSFGVKREGVNQCKKLNAFGF